jgi:hypothetical protein
MKYLFEIANELKSMIDNHILERENVPSSGNMYKYIIAQKQIKKLNNLRDQIELLNHDA